MSRRSKKGLRVGVATLVAALLLPAGAMGAETGTDVKAASVEIAAKSFDAVLLRPLGFVAFLVGAVAFVPAALISAPGGRDSFDAALEMFVTTPAEEVFQRPLGDF